MTDLMLKLRRSPRQLMERDGHPGPGPGHLAVVLSRAGVGKTAFLVGIGVDALLSGQRVLHVSLERTVDKVRDWYDDILMEMLAREKKLGHMAGIQIETERRRHIHTYVHHSFTVERFRSSLELLGQSMEFVPDVIIFDRLEEEGFAPGLVRELKEVGARAGAEMWLACRTFRDGPGSAPGHLPPPADEIEELVDLALRLDPHDAKIRLHLLKDRSEMIEKDLHILLDPRSLLLVPDFARH